MHRRHVYVQFDLWLKDRLALEQHTVRRSQKVPQPGLGHLLATTVMM